MRKVSSELGQVAEHASGGNTGPEKDPSVIALAATENQTPEFTRWIEASCCGYLRGKPGRANFA
jgi:hypothetical protein